MISNIIMIIFIITNGDMCLFFLL